MVSYRVVRGLSVVTLAEGKKVGQVDDLIVEPRAQAVRWLRLAVPDFFGLGKASWVSVEAVHSVGEHVVVIGSQGDLKRLQEVPEAARLARGRSLLGKKVITEGGRYLGEVSDFTFALSDFALSSIRVVQGNLFAQQTLEIEAGYLRTIGQDVIVVADSAPAAHAPQKQKRREPEPGAPLGTSGGSTRAPAPAEGAAELSRAGSPARRRFAWPLGRRPASRNAPSRPGAAQSSGSAAGARGAAQGEPAQTRRPSEAQGEAAATQRGEVMGTEAAGSTGPGQDAGPALPQVPGPAEAGTSPSGGVSGTSTEDRPRAARAADE